MNKITIIFICSFILLYISRQYYISSHTILSINCSQDYDSGGILSMVESANLETITDVRKLKELLGEIEYKEALDTIQQYNNVTKRNYAWRVKDYIEYKDSIIVEKKYLAKLILVYDNALIDTAGGDREYFFQIRTYSRNKKLIDKANFATWSRAKTEFCDGVLNDDYFLIRKCDGFTEVKRINKEGHFITPSKQTIALLKFKGY